MDVGKSFDGSSSSTRASAAKVEEEEAVIGLDHEAETIKERLIGGKKQLEVIPIIGMPGLGKTTLAKKVYLDPLIVYHFHICAWTYVSHLYKKGEVLVNILRSVKDKVEETRDEKLGEDLYKRLKGKRYLIVMDDIWDVGAWHDLKGLFPNDNNGSRIMLTSRHRDVALQARPHYLRFLSEDESWDLLHWKVFKKEICPPELVEIGKQIAQKCQGLPLAIVVVAGLLSKQQQTQQWWKQVAGSVSSQIVSDPKQYMDTLALSYNHLPNHLKPCFLYLGVFPEGFEISAKKLIWLWVAEGFIQQAGQKRLEDIAADYLMDLVDRSLVIVVQKWSSGEVKAFRIHDMLLDVCQIKAKEENFLGRFYGLDTVSSSSSSSSSSFSPPPPPPPPPCTNANKQRRICLSPRILCYYQSSLKPHCRHVRSFLCFGSELVPGPLCWKITSFVYQTFKLVKVLDLRSVTSNGNPSEIEQLVLLRYLALRIFAEHRSSPQIPKLLNLEILIIESMQNVTLPHFFWEMVKLRHLYIKPAKYHIERPWSGESEAINENCSYLLDNLQTISGLCPCSSCPDLLSRIPNLRSVGFVVFQNSDLLDLVFPDLSFLNYLETLKFVGRHRSDHWRAILRWVEFPVTIKRLSLHGTRFNWKQMSALGRLLPNLEALKLKSDACVGPRWETRVGYFPRLKFLKFDSIKTIVRWKVSSDHFPSLQSLVLHRCKRLQKIPSELGDIPTLLMLEVKWCTGSAADSARQIKEVQESLGNHSLKIHIYHSDW